MTGRHLLKKLNSKGLTISLDGVSGELKLKVRNGQRVDDELLAELRANKQSLIIHLEEQKIVEKLRVEFLKSKELQLASPARDTVYDASHQERKEYLRYLITGKNTSNLYFTCRLQHMEKDVIEAAVRAVFDRHESLRTSFASTEKGTVQVIRKQLDALLPIEFLDLRQANLREMVTEIKKDVDSISFDFEKGSLACVKLLALPQQEHVLVFIMHHAIGDDDSTNILKSEIEALCRSFTDRSNSQLPLVKTQFSDYAHWLNSWIESEAGRQHRVFYCNGIMESYKREQAETGSAQVTRSYRAELNDQLKKFGLTNSRAMSQEALGAVVTLYPLPGAVYVLFADEQLTNCLNELAAHCNTSLFMILISAFVILLYETEGRKNIRISIPFSTRSFDEFKAIVGWLTHNLIVCFEVDAWANRNEWITYVTETVLEASDFAVYPHELIMKDLDLPLDVLAPAYINLVRDKEEVITDFTPYHLKQGSGILPLKFIIKECKNGILLKLHYQIGKYSGKGIEGVGKRFIEILQRFANDPKVI
jgi:fengycin family lipopeptide synthetase D/gramicidin S synthase 2/tyrocidine synthetase-2